MHNTYAVACCLTATQQGMRHEASCSMHYITGCAAARAAWWWISLQQGRSTTTPTATTTSSDPALHRMQCV
jgi:hypothetical protein